MNVILTAKQLFSTLRHTLEKMPAGEREKFFVMVSTRAFLSDPNDRRDNNLSHEELFGHLKDEEFTAKDAAAYLDVSIPTFRRYIAEGKITASSEVGSSHLYPLTTLRALKKALKLVRN